MIQDWMISSSSDLNLIPEFGTTNPQFNSEVKVFHSYGTMSAYDPGNLVETYAWSRAGLSIPKSIAITYAGGYLRAGIFGYLVDPMDLREGGMAEWRFKNSKYHHNPGPRSPHLV